MCTSKIDIIVPSFNYADRIDKCLSSIIKQKFSNWRCIIVDDGSTDNSIDVIQKIIHEDSRFKLLTHHDGKNHGLKESIELALKFCESTYLAFLEADDEWHEDNLGVRLEVMEASPDVAFCFNMPHLEIENGADATFQLYLQRVLQYIARHRGPLSAVTPAEIFALNPLCSFSCVMVKREFFSKCSLNSPYPPILDKWLWQQMCLQGRCLFIARELTTWTLHPASYISRSKQNPMSTFLFIKNTRNLLLPQAIHRRNYFFVLLLLFYRQLSIFVRILYKFKVDGIYGCIDATKRAIKRILQHK